MLDVDLLFKFYAHPYQQPIIEAYFFAWREKKMEIIQKENEINFGIFLDEL